jgi:hypothetical protein
LDIKVRCITYDPYCHAYNKDRLAKKTPQIYDYEFGFYLPAAV